MPIVDGKSVSPDDAMHRGLCPECGTPLTPRIARGHAKITGATIQPPLVYLKKGDDASILSLNLLLILTGQQ
jgi:hypothetical protein